MMLNGPKEKIKDSHSKYHMKNTLHILVPLFCLFLNSSQLHAVTFDVELVCKKTTLFIDRGKVLAGFNKFKPNEMQKKDNEIQLANTTIESSWYGRPSHLSSGVHTEVVMA